MPKVISVKDKTHKRLSSFGKHYESFDDIINRLLDLADKNGEGDEKE